MEVNPQLPPLPVPPRLDPEMSHVDLSWPTTSEVVAVLVPPALGDAEQGALVVTDPLLPAQVSSFCI
jgi:hypothetical protein